MFPFPAGFNNTLQRMMNSTQITVLIPRDLKASDNMTSPRYLVQRLALHVLVGLWTQTRLQQSLPGTKVCTLLCCTVLFRFCRMAIYTAALLSYGDRPPCSPSPWQTS